MFSFNSPVIRVSEHTVPEEYFGLCQISMMKCFANIVNDLFLKKVLHHGTTGSNEKTHSVEFDFRFR